MNVICLSLQNANSPISEQSCRIATVDRPRSNSPRVLQCEAT